MLKQIGLGFLLVCICLAGYGCRNMQAQIAQAAPIINDYKDEWIEFRNCDGRTELKRSLATEKEVVQEIEIADEAVLITTGETIPLSSEMEANLVNQLRRAYRQEYDHAQDKVKKETFVVPPNKIRGFNIYCNERVINSTMAFEMDSQTYEVAFTFRMTIPYINDYWELACTA